MGKGLSKHMSQQQKIKQFVAGQSVEDVKKTLQPQAFSDLTQPLPNWHKGFGLKTIEKFDDFMFNNFLLKHPKLDIYTDSDKCDELEIEDRGNGTVEISYFFLMPNGETEIMIPVTMTGLERISEPTEIEDGGLVEWLAENATVQEPTKFVVVSDDNEPEYPISQLDNFIEERS